MKNLFKYCYQFNLALSQGSHAWPGGYPLYFVTADGGALSFKAAQDNAGLVRDAIIAGPGTGNDQWRVVGIEINWEEQDLTCEHTGERIECAYPGDDEETDAQPVVGMTHRTACGRGRITYRPDWSASQPWASYINGTAGRHFASAPDAVPYFAAKGMTLNISEGV